VSGECINRGEDQDRDDRLELYALGRLPASEVEKIEEHLLICDYCRDRLDEVAAFAFSAREALKQTAPERHSSFWASFSWLPNIGFWRPGLAVASGVAVLMLGIGTYRVRQDGALAPVAALRLTAMRSASVPIVPPSGELDIDFIDAPKAAKAIIVDAQGSTVWAGAAIHGSGDATIRVQAALAEGDYFVRVYTANGTIMHEYGFRIAR